MTLFSHSDYMLSLDEIKSNFDKTPVTMLQIDPNGYCNARCWFCPVGHYGSHPSAPLTPTQLEEIIFKLRKSRKITNTNFAYTAHYNEVLLYPHFNEMLDIFRKYNFKTIILTNGIALTPSKQELILKYTDVIVGICVNTPASNAEYWSKLVQLPKSIYFNLDANLRILNNNALATITTIQVNGVSEVYSQYTTLGKNAAETNANLIAGQVDIFKSRYNKLQNVFSNESLSDRAGSLASIDVLKNTVSKEPAIGCRHSFENGSRIYGWAHINSTGNLFLCCNDFHMEYHFGNLLENDFDDIWGSQRHCEVVQSALSQICHTCEWKKVA